MKKMLLASSFKDVASVLEDIEKNLENKRITFIPTASNVEKVNFFVKSGKKALEAMGLIVDELDVSTATYEEIKHKIEQNDYIYVTGGNTFYLLQELKKSKADTLIIQEIHKGKLYIGESAGSMIVSPDITYAQHMDSVKKAPELENYEALNITSFCLIPHYTNFPFKKQAEKINTLYQDTLSLVKISNHQAVIVLGDTYEIKTL